MRTNKETISRGLHWGFAGYVLLMVAVGFYMTNTDYSATAYHWHKSFGVLFGGLIGIRLYWRIRHPWKSSFAGGKYESLAHVTHRLLAVLLFAMPVTGLLNSGFSGFGVHLFEMVIIPQNVNEVGNIEAYNTTVYDLGVFAHGVLAYVFSALIGLHIAAALKHHFVDKDRTLVRMMRGD